MGKILPVNVQMLEQKDTKSRCGVCNKKLPLSAFPCRCEKSFCSVHRGDVAHSCPYDYKKEGKEFLSTMLVKVNAEKIAII